MTSPADLSEKSFGLWKVCSRGPNTKSGKATWSCLCECGTERDVVASSLVKGVSLSCGCRQPDIAAKANTTHGMTKTSEYRSWQMMMTRCYNENFPDYPLYGGRGVSVCERWKDASRFLEDMGRKPKGKTSIDRIDVNGNYEPDNCRWATQQEQMNNIRKNRFVCIEGAVMTVANAARKLNITYGAAMWATNTGKLKEVIA